MKNFFQGILLIMISESIFGLDITLYPDEKEAKIPIQPGCDYILDNTTNYEVDNEGDLELVVSAKAANTTPALLIVFCGSDEKMYNLFYINRSKYGSHEDADIINYKRPQSYSTLDYSQAINGPKSLNTSIIDKSYKPIQIGFNHSIFDLEDQDQYDQSVDLDNGFENFAIGNGVQRSTNIGRQTYKSRLRIWDFNGNGEVSNFNHSSDKAYRYTLITPFAFLFQKKKFRNDDEETKISKSLFFSTRSFYYRTQIARYNLNLRNAPNRIYYDITNSFNFRWLGKFSSKINTDGICEGATCILDTISLNNTSKFKKIEHEIIYSLLPHSLGNAVTYKLSKKKKVQLRYNKFFYPINEFNDIHWIKKSSSIPSEFMNTQAILQYTYSQFLLSFNYNQPLIPVNAREASSMSFGLTQSEKSFEYNITARTKPLASQKFDGFTAMIRYYTDTNIAYARNALKNHSISGKVSSIYSNKAAPNKTIRLKIDNETIGSTMTDKNGLYKFSSIPMSGEFEIFVAEDNHREVFTKPSFESEYIKDITVMDVIPFEVTFFIDNDKNGKISVTDSILPISNFDDLVGEGIISSEEARYNKNTVLVKRRSVINFTVAKEFLPTRYQFISLDPQSVEVSKTFKKGKVNVLLRIVN